MRTFGAGLGLAVVLATVAARAQPAPMARPPPPPATPPVAAAPPATAPPAPTPQPSQWHFGDPVPAGYHVEDQPRSGLVIAGALVMGIPYFFSAVTALAANENNETGWLLLPVAGPWITMGRRSYGCNPDQTNQTTAQGLQCVADVFAVMGLVFDGVMQAAGGALLLAGELATKPGLVRNEDALRIVPMHVGSGAGAGVVGTF
jgi:hypothetical protein